jgi:predicted O-methyltransferase YrrM
VAIGDTVADVPGMLRPEDEEKLYELALKTEGPILEIGTYRGRSTTIMAFGARAGAGALLVSVDVDPAAQRAAAEALRAHGTDRHVLLVRGSAAAALRRLAGLTPTLTFLDGDHSTSGVARDLAALEPAVPCGGLLLFHDFADPRNEDPAVREIGVKQGIRASWVQSQCEFVGEYGACGLFKRIVGGPAVRSVPVVDAVSLDSPQMQFLQRVRWPAGRFVRRWVRR